MYVLFCGVSIASKGSNYSELMYFFTNTLVYRILELKRMYTTSLDGGWGWVVVASAFVAQMLSDGISYGFGILYVDLMETFGGTSAEISSIGSLSYGSFCFIGNNSKTGKV